MEITVLQVLIGVLIVWNVFAFVVTWNDKRKSVEGAHLDRTPEGLLFFLAVAFGSAGVYLAMQLFRHKTKKWYFQLGIPLLLLQNVATLYLVVEIYLKT